MKDVTALYVISSLDNAFFSIARRGFFGNYLLLKAAKAEAVGISLMQTEIETSNATYKKKKCWKNGTIIKSLILHFITGLAFTIFAVNFLMEGSGFLTHFACNQPFNDIEARVCKTAFSMKYPLCQQIVPSFSSNWTLLEDSVCDMVSIKHFTNA